MTGFMGRTVPSSLFNARTQVTVVEVVTEIIIAIMVISFVTVLFVLDHGGPGGHYTGCRCASRRHCYCSGG
jgi:hypothetical protein